MKRLNFVCLFYILNLGLSSCSFRHHDHLLAKPINLNLKESKWLIDEPILDKINIAFESITTNYYKEILHKRFPNLKSISDLNNISSLKNTVEKNRKVLAFYKDQTNFDYLISTRIELATGHDPNLKLLSIKIVVHDLNTKSLIFENEYHSTKWYISSAKHLNLDKLKGFIDSSIKIAIKSFAKKDNWRTLKT